MKKTKKIKRVVVKIGSRVLCGDLDGPDEKFLREFAAGIARLHKKGYEIVIVSSGAIRTGAPRLGMKQARIGISRKQAAAAVGQGLLISKYIDVFSKHGIVVAQILLTPDITSARQMYLNARNTLRALLDMKVIPIINENDTVAYEEIKFGDNDRLSAISAIIVEADLLILLSDVIGLCSDDPSVCTDAKLLETVTDIDEEILTKARGPRENGGVGGMATKIDAAQMVMESGIRMVITHGREPRAVERILEEEHLGTAFLPKDTALSGRKKWLAFGCSPDGRIVVNEGAHVMIRDKGKSLLPSGVTDVEKEFEQGQCVEICSEDGVCFAKGLTNYSSFEIRRIKGRKSSEIKTILGFKIADEVIHRDDLVLIGD